MPVGQSGFLWLPGIYASGPKSCRMLPYAECRRRWLGKATRRPGTTSISRALSPSPTTRAPSPPRYTTTEYADAALNARSVSSRLSSGAFVRSRCRTQALSRCVCTGPKVMRAGSAMCSGSVVLSCAEMPSDVSTAARILDATDADVFSIQMCSWRWKVQTRLDIVRSACCSRVSWARKCSTSTGCRKPSTTIVRSTLDPWQILPVLGMSSMQPKIAPTKCVAEPWAKGPILSQINPARLTAFRKQAAPTNASILLQGAAAAEYTARCLARKTPDARPRSPCEARLWARAAQPLCFAHTVPELQYNFLGFY